MESLFTNIPLEETINISSDTLFANEAKMNNFNRNDFKKLLRMALQITSSILTVKAINKLIV